MFTTSRSHGKARTIGLADVIQGVSHYTSPDCDVWCLEDGTYVFDAADFPGLSYDEQQTRLNAAGLTDIETVFNAFLIRDASGYTLVDTGCGPTFGDGAGFLTERLAALQVEPDAIKRLIFTHLHTDHCGGALKNGAPAFRNAEVVLHEREQAHWAEKDHLSRDVLTAYASQIRTVADDEVIAPGLTAWALPGHTPGHIGVRVGDRLVLVGDIIHSEALQLGDPRLSSENDTDPWDAAECRLDALREIAAGGLMFAGGHILGPDKFAQLAEIGDGFARVPR